MDLCNDTFALRTWNVNTLWGRCMIWCVESRGTNKMQLGSTLHMQLWLWNQTPKSLLLRYCPGGCGTTDKHWLAAAQLDFLPVDERDAIMWLRNAEKTAITVVCAYALVYRRWATVTGKL